MKLLIQQGSKRTRVLWIAATAIGGVMGYLGPFALLWALLGASENKLSPIWTLLVPVCIWAFVYGACLGFERVGPPYVNFPLAIIAGAYLCFFLLVSWGLVTGSSGNLGLTGILFGLPVLAVVPLAMTWPALVYISRASIDFGSETGAKPAWRNAQILKLFVDEDSER